MANKNIKGNILHIEDADKKIFMPFDIVNFLKLMTWEECQTFFDCACYLMDEKPLPTNISTAVKMSVLHLISMQKFAPNYEEESEE